MAPIGSVLLITVAAACRSAASLMNALSLAAVSILTPIFCACCAVMAELTEQRSCGPARTPAVTWGSQVAAASKCNWACPTSSGVNRSSVP